MPNPFGNSGAATFLAPMQDITDAHFMRIVADCGAPDFFVSEYLRVHEYFEIEKHILDTLLCNLDGKPVCAQIIGENEAYISKAISALKKYPQITMLDLNLGCPAPKIYRKNVGGGLLRDTKKIRSILKVMRGEWEGCLSVKMRTGFEYDWKFSELLEAVLENSIDFITVHARTVKQLYRGVPNYEKISEAVKLSPVPIIANGDITSADKASQILNETKCKGVMSGRHAVRNPWIFRQIKEKLRGEPIFQPTLEDVRVYIDKLYAGIISGNETIRYVDSRLKKFLNFVGAGVDEEGEFLYKMRRARGMDALLKVCDECLIDNGNNKKLFADEPYPDVCSRPNHEI